MPRIIKTTVYDIKELPEAAKARAREWYVLNVLNEGDWYEQVLDDFEEIAGILGITLRTRSRRDGSPERTCVWFSGFSQQGDGASFEGSWEYGTESCRKIREHAPLDKKLHEIADTLASAQKPNFYELSATISHHGQYNHEYCMTFEIERNSATDREPTEGSAETVSETMRTLARWLYHQLEAEYDHQWSDNTVDDVIQANGWPFTANGAFFSA